MIISGWKFKRESKGTAIYRTTDKGIALLHVYQRIRDLLSPDTTTTIGSLTIDRAYLCGITCRRNEKIKAIKRKKRKS